MKQLLRKSILCGSAAVMTMAAVAGTAGLATVTALAEEDSVPSINEITLGEDYQDITASITVLTNRTDIADTTYAEYAEQFSELYPNITVTYDAITDYEESLTLRLITGDWGDICFIPTSVDKDELSNYFLSFGDYDTLSGIYNFLQEGTYSGEVYGIANGGTATGIVYNKRIWEEAGIEEMPTTPEEFLEDLQLIADNTDSIPLYTNFAASWTMGQWDAYIGIAATGDADYMNNTIVHTSNPFSATEDMTGPYAVYYVLYEAVARGLVEEDPASTDWESSKSMMNSGEIATMVLGSWAVEQCKEVGDNGDDVGYAGKDAFLYYGFKEEITKEEFAERIEKDTLPDVLNAVPVRKGDVLFIEPGTIHAIGQNILIAEIQQNSNVTYRVYDYGRVGKDGKKRDLHIEKALAVTNRVPLKKR